MTTLEHRICGIPCLIRVDHYFEQKPLGIYADSDHDCYGYTECEYTVLDRRGREAPWLEKKLDDDARIAIEKLISSNNCAGDEP